MPTRIYKQQFDAVSRDIKISIPIGARFLSVMEQDGSVTVWYVFDIEYEKETKLVTFHIFGTGWEIPNIYQYIGTCKVEQFVWHLYYKIED